jgi:hypothetical protein
VDRESSLSKLEGGYRAKTQGPIGLSLESLDGKVKMQIMARAWNLSRNSSSGSEGMGCQLSLKWAFQNGNLGLEGSWRFLVVGTRHLEMVGHFDATVMPHPRTRFNIRNARQLDAKHRLYPA